MHEDYESLPGFEHVLLEESYVLDIEVQPGLVEFTVELLLLPEHPEYRAPVPGERACFRDATITFPSVRALHRTGQGARPARDASGTLDFGSVDSMTGTDDGYRVLGDWGDITLRSDPPTVSLHPTPTP